MTFVEFYDEEESDVIQNTIDELILRGIEDA